MYTILSVCFQVFALIDQLATSVHPKVYPLITRTIHCVTVLYSVTMIAYHRTPYIQHVHLTAMAVSASLRLITSESSKRVTSSKLRTCTYDVLRYSKLRLAPVLDLPYPAQIQGSLWCLHAMIHQLLDRARTPPDTFFSSCPQHPYQSWSHVVPVSSTDDR